jgi:hypothetical protein
MSAEPQGKERRRAPRLSIQLPAAFTDLKSGRTQQALTKDISSIGVCLATEDLLALGAPVKIEFTLPDRDRPITLMGEVIWSWPGARQSQDHGRLTAKSGLVIVSIDPKDRAAIAQYARLNAPLAL